MVLLCVCSYICIRERTRAVNERVSHQHPVEANTVVDDKPNNLFWWRVWMEYPELKRVSPAITAKSLPAIATTDLNDEIYKCSSVFVFNHSDSNWFGRHFLVNLPAVRFIWIKINFFSASNLIFWKIFEFWSDTCCHFHKQWISTWFIGAAVNYILSIQSCVVRMTTQNFIS